MFRFDGAGFSDVYASSITQLQLATMLIAMIVLIVSGAMVHQQTAAAPRPQIRAARLRALSAAQCLVWPMFLLAMLKLSAPSFHTFLYLHLSDAPVPHSRCTQHLLAPIPRPPPRH